MRAFYFEPNAKKISFDEFSVGVKSLNKISPDMSKAAGLRRKTTHCTSNMSVQSV